MSDGSPPAPTAGPSGGGGVSPGGWEGTLPFMRAVAQLLSDLARDSRVPRRAKIIAAVATAYVVSPLDPIPDFVPVIGMFDDALVVGWALRRVVKHAGYDLIRELWTGSNDGFALLLFMAGVER